MDSRFTHLVRRAALVSFLAAGYWLLALPASAGILTGVVNDPPLPMEFHGDDQLEDMIMVGSPSQPIRITPDPNGPPWMKLFTINRDGQGWGTDGPNSMVTIMEIIEFFPGTVGPVVDWHEDIDVTVGDGANFKWAGGMIEKLGVAGVPLLPGMISPDGKSIWFDFPPAMPGMPLKITKQLMWAGTGPITPGPNGTNNYVIKVNERPSIVPEPGSLMLLCVALGLAACQQRR